MPKTSMAAFLVLTLLSDPTFADSDHARLMAAALSVPEVDLPADPFDLLAFLREFLERVDEVEFAA